MLSVVYGVVFVMSLLLLPLYFLFVHKKQKEPWLFVLFISVATVNLGYLMISRSSTVGFALFSNKIAYLGQVLIPICMLMIIAKLCDMAPKKHLTAVLMVLAAMMFGLVCTTGYLDIYYADAKIAYDAGAAYLIKEYGILHPTNFVYVIAYFAAMLAVIGVSFFKNKGGSQKLAVFMLVIVLGNIGMWMIEKLVKTNFEVLSVSYLMSEFAFFTVFLMLQDYIHIKDLPPVDAEKNVSAADGGKMAVAEKIQKIMASLPEGGSLTARQTEILELMLEHKSRKEIAAELHLSENTVKTHTSILYRTLGVSGKDGIYIKYDI